MVGPAAAGGPSIGVQNPMHRQIAITKLKLPINIINRYLPLHFPTNLFRPRRGRTYLSYFHLNHIILFIEFNVTIVTAFSYYSIYFFFLCFLKRKSSHSSHNKKFWLVEILDNPNPTLDSYIPNHVITFFNWDSVLRLHPFIKFYH